MYHSFAGFLTGSVLLLASCGISFAQETGASPGPIPPATVQQFDVTFYRWNSTTEGTFDFSAAEDPTSVNMTGAFEANVNDESLTGTWYAYDFGNFAIWAAQASGETNSLDAFGWSTPEILVGRATLGPPSTGFWAFLRRLRTLHFLVGERVVTEPPTDGGDTSVDTPADDAVDTPTDMAPNTPAEEATDPSIDNTIDTPADNATETTTATSIRTIPATRNPLPPSVPSPAFGGR